jgi:CRISPR-associated DxTHG motif protein
MAISEAVQGNAEIVVDVTHSLRHLPFVLFASLTYLTACKQVKVRGVYYGAFEAKTESGAPIVDLGSLLTLSDWYHGVRTFAETGNPDRVAALLREAQRTLVSRSREPDPILGRLQGSLKGLGWSLPTGLPLEVGLKAALAVETINQLVVAPSRVPIVPSVFDGLRDALANLAISTQAKTKATIRLDVAELRRQLCLVRFYVQRHQTDRALLLLREWIINRCLLASGVEESAWLEYGRTRHPMERALNALAERQQAGGHEAGWALGSFWKKIADRRNAIAHAGFRVAEVTPDEEILETLVRECESRTDDDAWWNTAVPGPLGKVLVTAMGLSPGVLYTAIRQLEPERVLAITSAEARPQVAEACSQAHWDAERVSVYVVPDAHACFAEVEQILVWASPLLLDAREVVVNLTGGTTAMQYLVERVAGQASRFGVPVERYALLDRRSPDAQRRDPYVAGEVVPLRGDEGSAGRE